ncbi:MAG: AAA family ATPase [Candidatus Margulisiibacteriota bacterium]
MNKKFVLTIIFILLLSVAAFAQTANDYFDQASTKYLLGNPQGALADLRKALELDPAHSGARQLYSTIQAELGAKQPPVEPTPAPQATPTEIPQPAPPAKSVEKTVIKYIERPSNVRAHSTTTPMESTATREITAGSLNTAEIIGSIVLYVFYILLVLGGAAAVLFLGYLIYKLKPHRLVTGLRSKLICPICKAENPPTAEFCFRCGAKMKVWANVSDKQKSWYKQHHWKKNPFTLNALPELFTGHADQVKWIIEKVHAKSGHVLVMGPIGIGKTTLLKWLEMHLQDGAHALYISRPPKQFGDLLKLIAVHLKFKIKKNQELTIYNIGDHIKKTRKGLILLLDEAHEFDQEIERQLRTLGDLDEINFVIAGLPETAEKFKKEFPPIYDRIVAEVILKELTLGETKELIKKRIADAGGHDLEPFSEGAIERIYELSKGIPRATLKTCDWAVTEAIREGHTKIDTPVMI